MSDPGYRTCADCLDRIRERLAEVGTRYAVLDPRPGAQGDDGGPRPPGFGSRSPASDHVVAVMDWRSSRVARVWRGADGRVHRESQRPPLSVLAELFTLAQHVATERNLTGPVLTVADIARWLDGQLDWVTRQPGVVEFDRVLRELVSQLRPLTGEPRPKRIGECPNTIQLEDDTTRECGAPLFAPLKSDEISCRACGRRWPREEWLRLGKVLQAA